MLYKAYILPRVEYCSKLLLGINKTLNKKLESAILKYCNSYHNSVTSVNLKNAGMASRNIVMKSNIRCYDVALQLSLDFTFFGSELCYTFPDKLIFICSIHF